MKRLILILSMVIGIGLVAGNGFITPVNTEARETTVYEKPETPLQTGDIVLRSGKGFISDMFRNFSSDKHPWSHAGILVEENGTQMVYHMMGSDQLELDGFRVETLSRFVNSRQNKGFAVYRISEIEGKEDLLTAYLHKLEKSKIRFDQKFNFSDDQFMYCTEMIYKAYDQSANIKLGLSDFKGTPFVAIDDLIDPSVALPITETIY